jgi:hypothetical protein
MLGNAPEALVALFGLFGVGAVVCAIVWTLSSLGVDGRTTGFFLSSPPLGLASISTFIGWLFGWL